MAFTSVNHNAPLQPFAPSNAPVPAAGTKRKRENKGALKFYAVRVGKEPGIYHSWAECLDQVKGFPKAVFKSFTSLADAENFVNNEGTIGGGESKVTKYYGVRSGRVPGVYTSWQEVLDQITGWKAPKHRGFKTKTEAEGYVAEGRTAADEAAVGSIEQSEPAQKKSKSSKSKKGNGVKDESSPALGLDEGGEYEPGDAPLPDDAEDGFDSWIMLDHAINGARYKTRQEREAVTYEAVRPIHDAPIRIYTDGSSLSNGQANAWGGVGVYFGPADRRNISEPLEGVKQTNQRAELTAIARALEVAPKDRKVVIVCDSKYSIDCVTDWYEKWEQPGARHWRNAARKSVENRDLVEKILELLRERERLNEPRMDDSEKNRISQDKRARWDKGPGGVRFEWVKGHDKDEGNAAADSLAVAGARAAQEFGEDIKWED